MGTTVDGRYRIKERLGQGGMGAVYVAEHLKLRKDVAFKVVHFELADDPEIATRFAREASASARLDHPHVAAVLDYGTMASGASFMAMQLVRGRSLREQLDQGGALEWRAAVEIAAQVADAMLAAHEAGIIHRDIKPDNVLLEQRTDHTFLAKVLDFGVARVRLEGTAPEGAAPEVALTRLGTVVGTPGYMAPEQAMGETVDERADLYSLGVILWEMLAGKRLYPEAELAAIVTRQLTDGPPALEVPSGRAPVPPEVEPWLRALLEPRAANRPGSAREVRDALRALAYGRPVSSGTPPARSGAWAVGPRGHLLSGAIGASFGIVLSLLLAAVLTGRTAPSRIALDKASAPHPTTSEAAPVTSEAESTIDELLQGQTRSDRRRAAHWILDHADDVPKFARVVARLETAPRCAEQREAIEALVELDDARTAPSVARFARARSRGCGFLGLGDCYRCIRPVAAEALRQLEQPDDG